MLHVQVGTLSQFDVFAARGEVWMLREIDKPKTVFLRSYEL